MQHGLSDLFTGLVTGARNMIGIGIATAAAGIIVGTVTLTGIGLVMTEFVEVISGGNLMVMLLAGGGDLPDPGHGPAHHGQPHRGVHADGAGGGGAALAERACWCR